MNPPLSERRERTLDNPHIESAENVGNFGGMSTKQLRNKFASSTRLIKKSTTAAIRTQDSNGSIEFEGGVPKFGSTVRLSDYHTII
jgi:hypothetical protein